MTVTTASRSFEDTTPTRAVLPTAFDHAPALVVPGPWQRVAAVVGDLLGGLVMLLSIPLAILAVGVPLALCVRLVLWLGGLL